MRLKNPFSKEEEFMGAEGRETPEGGMRHRCGEWCGEFGKHIAEIWSVLGVLLIAGVIWIALGNFGLLPRGDFPPVPGSRWQAVFLSNNQVYFGRLENYNREYVMLTNVYYLQAQQPVQPGQAPANLNIIKLGSEIHGPEDVMFIPKKQILFWENLNPDSQMVQAIESTRR